MKRSGEWRSSMLTARSFAKLCPSRGHAGSRSPRRGLKMRPTSFGRARGRKFRQRFLALMRSRLAETSEGNAARADWFAALAVPEGPRAAEADNFFQSSEGTKMAIDSHHVETQPVPLART